MDFDTLWKNSGDLYDLMNQADKGYHNLWLHDMLFTWRWWVTVCLLIIPWIVWLIVRKKDSTYRLLLVYFFISTLATLFDIIGISFHLWSYPISVLPFMPSFFQFNYSVLPITTMLFIQFLPNVKVIYKALVYAALAAFIFEPIMEWMGMVYHNNWNHFYSFGILFLFYLAANFFATRKQYEPITKA